MTDLVSASSPNSETLCYDENDGWSTNDPPLMADGPPQAPPSAAHKPRANSPLQPGQMLWSRPGPPARSTATGGSSPHTRAKPTVYITHTGGAMDDEHAANKRDLQQDLLDGLGCVERKLSELGNRVNAHKLEWETQLASLLKQVSVLQSDVNIMSVSLGAVRRKQESNRKKIKEYEDSLQAAKDSWEEGEEKLRGIVARAQSALQSGRSDLEKALASIPGKEMSFRDDLDRIRVSVAVLGGKVRGVEGRVIICEGEGEANAAALEQMSIDVADIRDKLSGDPHIALESPQTHEVSTQTDVIWPTSGEIARTGLETRPSSIASSPVVLSSNLDSSFEDSPRMDTLSSNLSSEWAEAFDSDSRNEATSFQSSRDEGYNTNSQLFDPSATVTLPDPLGTVTSGLIAPSRTMYYTAEEHRRQRAVIRMLDNIGADDRLQACLRFLLTIGDTIFCRNGRVSFQFHGMFPLLFGTPGSLHRRRVWLAALAVLAAFLLIVDPWRARRLERPAYEAFQRRRNLLRWSTPDVIDSVLTYYLSVLMYLI